MKTTILRTYGNATWRAVFLLSLICAAFFSFWGCRQDPGQGVTVPVMISDAEGLQVLSQNPVYVPVGGAAEFEIALGEGIAITDLPTGVTVKGNRLVVENVFFPRTVDLTTQQRVLCDFSAAVSSGESGSLASTLGNGKHWSYSEITLTATPKEGYYFVGYSVGATVENGGTVVSIDPRYTFTLIENISIFANFAIEWIDPATTVPVPDDKWVLIYHANGGVLGESGQDGMKTVMFSNEFYLCPNTLVDRDYFTRDGYVLLGYNTKPDGSGTYYAPGWNVVMPARGAISLYCVWAKETDPSYFACKHLSNGTVSILQYTGTDAFVVIPEEIDGKPVAAIEADAISQNVFVKQLMISKNVRTLANRAVDSCPNLQALYFSDSVTSVRNDSFYNCPNLSRINMMAVVAATFQGDRHGSCAVKYERLLVEDRPKIVVSCGSNIAYGLSSPQLESLINAGGYDYAVVNYGTSAGISAVLQNEVIARLMRAGDILIFAPEADTRFLGGINFSTTTWQIFEGAYDAIALVDIRNYTNFFSSFASFNGSRNQTRVDEHSYEYYSDRYDQYGEAVFDRPGYSSSYAKKVQEYLNRGGFGDINYYDCERSIRQNYQNLNIAFDIAAENGGTVLMSFAVINRLALTSESQIAGGAAQTAYESAARELLHVTMISRISTYVMDTEYFYDSDQHTRNTGSSYRTPIFAQDILHYLGRKH